MFKPQYVDTVFTGISEDIIPPGFVDWGPEEKHEKQDLSKDENFTQNSQGEWVYIGPQYIIPKQHSYDYFMQFNQGNKDDDSDQDNNHELTQTLTQMYPEQVIRLNYSNKPKKKKFKKRKRRKSKKKKEFKKDPKQPTLTQIWKIQDIEN